MTCNKKRRVLRTPDLMIDNASALLVFAKSLCDAQDSVLNREEGEEIPHFDGNYFRGRFLSIPLLLSYAIELVLKAWKCREGSGPHLYTHDLLDLFDDLRRDTQDLLEKATLTDTSLRQVLCKHHNVFVESRYPDQDKDGVGYAASALWQALGGMIVAYNNKWRGSA